MAISQNVTTRKDVIGLAVSSMNFWKSGTKNKGSDMYIKAWLDDIERVIAEFENEIWPKVGNK